jgi:hypothetical protein
MVSKLSEKISTKFYCEKCDYYAKRNSDLKKHFMTNKHKMIPYDTKKVFWCECGKKYKHRQNLYRHKKSCDFSGIIWYQKSQKKSQLPSKPYMETIEKLIEQNQDLTKQNSQILDKIADIASKPKTVLINQQNTQNNTFRIVNYLNKECRHAVNILDYINNIRITNDDLLYIHNNSISDSIDTCFVKPIANLEQERRPIHCTDTKRHKFMIKHDGVWQKDTDYKILSNSFYSWANKVGHQLIAWTHEDTEWSNNDDKLEMSNDLIRKLHLLRFDENTNKKVIQKMKQFQILKNDFIQDK